MDSKKFLELYKKKGTGGRPWAGATGIYMVAPSCPANFFDGETCENPVPKNGKIGKGPIQLISCSIFVRRSIQHHGPNYLALSRAIESVA